MSEPRRPSPPGPGPQNLWAQLRFLRSMQQDVLGTVHRRFESFGDLYAAGTAAAPLFVTRHPDHFHEVLVTRAADFAKRGDLVPLFGQGLLTANGEDWRRKRRLIQPSFRHDKLSAYAHTMVRAADALAEEWAHNPDRDVGADMNRLTLAVVAKALFDHEADHQVDRVAHCMDVLQRSVVALDVLPQWMPTPLHRKRRRALRELDALITDIMDARARQLEAAGRSGPPPADLLGQLIVAGDLDRRQLRDELVTLYLAGHETTALTLTWTWWLLARHPQWEKRLHQEIDAVLGERAPAPEDLETLSVCRRVINESMRLFPPAYAVPRIAERATEVGGYSVPAGAEVVLWLYWAHHDPRWFPGPERFDPDRFAPSSAGVRHPHAFIPFGAGQRTCIGRHFAMMEATLILARLAQRFGLRASDDQAPGLYPRITLGPRRRIRMRARRRGGLLRAVEPRPAQSAAPG